MFSLRLKTLFFVEIFLLLANTLSGQIIDKNAIAAATVVKGEVWLKSVLLPKHGLKPGEQIFAGDTLITEDSGYAEITFLFGKRIIKIQSNSEIIFKMKKPREKLLPLILMKIGKIWMKIFGSPGETEIETPNAVVSVKGTEFLLIFTPEKGTQLFVVEGVVELKNELGAVKVMQNQQSLVKNHNAPSSPKTVSIEKIDSFWRSKPSINIKSNIRDTLLRDLLHKLGLVDSLQDFELENVKIIGGNQNANEYLQFILRQNPDKILWELETEKDGKKRLKIILENYQPKIP